MVHLIDHSDHLQHLDPSISRVHFLTWTPTFHSWVNKLIREGENRLRHHQYRPIFRRAGYEVISESTETDERTRSSCGGLAMTAPFNDMTPEQIAIMTSVYVLRRAAA